MLLSKEDFASRIAGLVEVRSMTGKASYKDFRLVDGAIYFTRSNTGQPWSIKLDELYNAYLHLTDLRTTLMKEYVTNRTQSPACAILMAIGVELPNKKRLRG